MKKNYNSDKDISKKSQQHNYVRKGTNYKGEPVLKRCCFFAVDKDITMPNAEKSNKKIKFVDKPYRTKNKNLLTIHEQDQTLKNTNIQKKKFGKTTII